MRYKNMIIATLCIAFVVLVGLGIYSHVNSKNMEESAKVVYKFQKQYYDGLLDNKVTKEVFVQEFIKVNANTNSFKSLVPLAVVASDFFLEKGDNLEAKSILAPLVEKHTTNPSAYFLKTRLAVALEDLGETNEAISILKDIVGSKESFLQAKIYTDLGRLYLKAGDKDNAKKSFEYVIENFKASEFLRVAKVYLAEM